MRKLKKILISTVFILVLLPYFYGADIQCIWTDVKKIVAVGDLHGDYENFITILRGTKLIDKNNRWIGGKTHLVQIGDVMDKGDYAKKIFDLLMRLEKEAEEAGGKVHSLIGNHEEWNIADLALDFPGYVTYKQFISFLTDDFKKKQEKKFRRKREKNFPKKTNSDSSTDYNFEEEWNKILREVVGSDNHPARRNYSKNFNKKYGKWILKNNAVIKINDIIFVHGGISEEFSTEKLKDINNRLRFELEDQRWAVLNSKLKGKIPEPQIKYFYIPEGPLWYRGLATMPEDNFKENVTRILNNLKAHYIVTAHTPMRRKDEESMKRFNDRVWIIDTNISRVYRYGRISALIIEEYGKIFRVLWFGDSYKTNESQNKIQFQSKILSIEFGYTEVQLNKRSWLIAKKKNNAEGD
ncbi:MAG: metallophosphoesterase [Candidatus Aminicenantes bacterium]|nr:metallophosphoesterase [Candidatus Aminicenantes bacterium]